MRRLSSILSAAALTVAVLGGTSHSLVISESVGAVDNLAPAPVTQLKALEAGSGTTRSVVLTWVPSVDDAVTYANFGSGYYPRGGVDGYRIYRAAGATGQPVLLATLSSGVSTYTDATVERGQSYVYSVNPFDTANETTYAPAASSAADLARIVVVSSGIPPVHLRLTLSYALDLTNGAAVTQFTQRFIADLASLLGISATRITVTQIRAGSTIVEFTIAEPSSSSGEPSSSAVATTLGNLARSPSDPFANLGTILSLSTVSGSTSTPLVVKPLGSDGRPVLGWFARQGSTVGFEDFFLFADHFGLQQGNTAFDSRYDLIVDGKIDFLDFFRFADDFGRTIVNAAQVVGD
jgi:hypothetical protein